MNINFPDEIILSVEAAVFDGNRPTGRVSLPAAPGTRQLRLDGSLWRSEVSLKDRGSGIADGEARFTLEEGAVPCGNVSVAFRFDRWSESNYVLMPAAAYDGNRFRAVSRRYPPFLHDEDGIGPDMPLTVTDVPRLNAGPGPSRIHLRAGDLATPAVGIRSHGGRGFLLLFEPVTAFGYTGVRLEESDGRRCATLAVEAPAVRERLYTMGNSGAPSDDRGASFAAGDTVSLRFRVVRFGCPDIPALFDALFDHRRDLCPGGRLVHGLPLSAAYRIIERKYNQSQFNEQYRYYMLSPDGEGTPFGDWQAGWCGGGMSSLALYCDGDALSRRRADATMDSVFSHLQAPSGFILPIFTGGQARGDDFCHNGREGVALVRKEGDVLLFAARHILLMQKRGEVPPQCWLTGLGRLAGAFVRLWERYGQFGQFIDIHTGGILQGGTACGSVVPGGLILAWRLLGCERYRAVAEASADHYNEHYLAQGLLNGGPGEILQCPDSESASNLLESLVTLYEVTGNRRFLPMAEDAARHCASWTVSYDFPFPAGSAFGSLGMRTTGSVWANVQNKHSAPGFCTLSGASLLRLFRATEDRRYLEMTRETAHNITQYLSRGDRPIPTWDGGPPLPAGWMCERVNMSDWEGKKNIGGVFYGGCWCEVSCLLSYAEIPGVWFFTDTGEAVSIDHVDAAVADGGSQWQLTLANPTAFDADVKLLCEPRAGFRRPWDPCVMEGCRIVTVAAGSSRTVRVGKAASPQPPEAWNNRPDLRYNPQ